jgi:hypothetical protein
MGQLKQALTKKNSFSAYFFFLCQGKRAGGDSGTTYPRSQEGIPEKGITPIELGTLQQECSGIRTQALSEENNTSEKISKK